VEHRDAAHHFRARRKLAADIFETDFAWDTIDPGKLPSAPGAGGSTSIKDASNR
jgi:hypothetical protein